MALSAARHLTSMRQCFLRGSFGLKKPIEQDERWANVLRVYATSDMWPEVPLPCKKDLLHTLLHTKDSAPGSGRPPLFSLAVTP